MSDIQFHPAYTRYAARNRGFPILQEILYKTVCKYYLSKRYARHTSKCDHCRQTAFQISAPIRT